MATTKKTGKAVKEKKVQRPIIPAGTEQETGLTRAETEKPLPRTLSSKKKGRTE